MAAKQLRKEKANIYCCIFFSSSLLLVFCCLPAISTMMFGSEMSRLKKSCDWTGQNILYPALQSSVPAEDFQTDPVPPGMRRDYGVSTVMTGYHLPALPRSSSAKSSTSHWQLVGLSPNFLSLITEGCLHPVLSCCWHCEPLWPMAPSLVADSWTSPHKHRLESETAQEKIVKNRI